MNENVIVKENLPADIFADDRFYNLKSQFINILSENELTISQTRYLFNSIISQFEREMPVTNHKKK